MKYLKILFFISILILLSGKSFSQVSHGIVKEGLTVHSKILNKDVRYTIYLPFDYNSSDRYYPVVYLLHGYTDNDIAWIQFGEANMIADKAIAENEIPPMILVMPDAGVSFYVNNYNGKDNYEDFFFKEFIPYIESHYRILSEKRFRAVAGLSMGGYGSLVYGLKHTDMFSSCVAFSAAIQTDDQVINMPDKEWDKIWGVVFGPGLKGKARLTKLYKEDDPFYIIKNNDATKFRSLRLYIDCGDDDFLYKGNSEFHILLREKNIHHEYRVRNGTHLWKYWRSGLLNALKFIGVSFHQS